jgi:hypothetical protein
MFKHCYETNDGRYAEYHSYQIPCVDDDGMPDGWAEQIEVYTFPNISTNEFVTRTFYTDLNAQLFLKLNGYEEIVK